MKRILIYFSLLLPHFTFCQIDSLPSSIITPINIQDSGIYIKIVERISHRYNSPNYNQRNIRLKMSGNNFIYEILSDSNIVISSYLCKPFISYEHYSFPEGDSMRENEVNMTILGEDRNLPSEIIIYNIALQKHGYYYEYFTNGSIKTKGNYKNGQKNGRWIYYKPDGHLIKKERYKYKRNNKNKHL